MRYSNHDNLHKSIKVLCKKQGITLKELYQKLDVKSGGTYYTVLSVIRISNYFDISITDMLEGKLLNNN